MAQLPPKIPITPTPNWMHTNFGHQKSSPCPSTLMSTTPTWVDDFLDFSSTCKRVHRRSASDSVTFLAAVDHENSGACLTEFDRIDDHQFMSMFSDEVGLQNLNPSTPSDENSDSGEERKRERPEVKSEMEKEEEECRSVAEPSPPSGLNDVLDPKRVKRILANRQSAQRSRVRKLKYISELERSVNYLQTEVSTLSPRVAFFDHQRSVLTVGNTALRQRIAALAQDKIFKDAHQEALKKEIERLNQVYHQQNHKNMATGTPLPTTSTVTEEELVIT